MRCVNRNQLLKHRVCCILCSWLTCHSFSPIPHQVVQGWARAYQHRRPLLMKDVHAWRCGRGLHNYVDQWARSGQKRWGLCQSDTRVMPSSRGTTFHQLIASTWSFWIQRRSPPHLCTLAVFFKFPMVHFRRVCWFQCDLLDVHHQPLPKTAAVFVNNLSRSITYKTEPTFATAVEYGKCPWPKVDFTYDLFKNLFKYFFSVNVSDEEYDFRKSRECYPY